MSSLLCLTVRFLQPYFHGRGERGEPEWPPSPLRLFQALVEAAAGRWNEREHLQSAVVALRWLEQLPPPVMVAPQACPATTKYRLYVPDNVGDLVAKSWTRGNAADIGSYRSEKDVCPMRLVEGGEVHYLFSLPEDQCPYLEILTQSARSMTHLGWGVDMVVGNAMLLPSTDADALAGERWMLAKDDQANRYRLPCQGTLDELMHRHRAFLDRLSPEGFRPVPPLIRFRSVGYRRATDTPSRPWLALEILRPDMSGRRAFDTVRRARDVAALVRHAVGQLCANHWPFGDADLFVHGHTSDGKPLKGERADERFMYLPLPTINAHLNRVEAIRRVLITAPIGFSDRLDWLRRRLPGQDLVQPDGTVAGLLNLLVGKDWVLEQYTQSARCWSTVTPVVLPGHDDHQPAKAERLLRRSFVDADYNQALVDSIVDLQWRHVGFRPGQDLAPRYARPDNLRGPMYHVRIQFAHDVRGPVAIGAGRYRGLGVFAAEALDQR